MLRRIKEFFKGDVNTLDVDKDGRPSDHELLIATAVLLVEMASTDQAIERAEAEAVCKTLSKEFNVAEDDIPELVQIAVAARKEQGKIDDFVAAINTNFQESQKQRILAMIWKVVMADGKVDKFEQRFAAQMRNRLQLSKEQATQAKQMVESGKV